MIASARGFGTSSMDPLVDSDVLETARSELESVVGLDAGCRPLGDGHGRSGQKDYKDNARSQKVSGTHGGNSPAANATPNEPLGN